MADQDAVGCSAKRGRGVKRRMQGACILLGTIVATAGVLAAAVAWGPHQHCKPAFPMIIGCAMGSYESLAGGLIAAGVALFAGWLAWSAIQMQIASEERRATAERDEVERILQDDLDTFGEALGAIWKILERFNPKDDPETNRDKLSGILLGIEELTKEAWLSSSRQMVAALGWGRRRQYEELFAGLERLGRFRDDHDVDVTLVFVRSLANDFELLRSDTARYFEGRFRRSGKAYSVGYAVEVTAGVAEEGRSSFDPRDDRSS